LALALALAALGVAPRAGACSFLEVAIETSYPVWGAIGVPTNAVLYVVGERITPDWLSLETAAGHQVPIRVSRVLPTGFDITPAIELEPNQRYVLLHPNIDLIGPVSLGVEFETGSGPSAPAALPPPDLAGAVLISQIDSACFPFTRLCLEPGGEDATLFAAHSLVTLSEQTPGALVGFRGRTYVPDDCLQVWRRDALGNRSEMVELCGADVPLVELSGDAASLGCAEALHPPPVTTELADANLADEKAGCSLSLPGKRASSRAPALALGLLSLIGMIRRRRQLV
jgi:hypothetical protein